MKKNDIYRSIKNYNHLGRSSFHTPAHKNNSLLNQNLSLSEDITELPDTDDLYTPTSCIDISEKKATKFYETKKTIFSAGGNTLCIQTMLKLVCNAKVNHIMFSRNIHRSVINTMALLNIIPHWILPQKYLNSNYPYYINPEEILSIFKKNENIKAVFITSPDYYGNILNIKEISEVCKQFSVPLLVDNAHGSHLICIDKNSHPINQGASLVADSIHKTLPSLTGSALLHITDDKLIPYAKYSMSMFGSTSPSFLILSSIDLCIDWIAKNGHNEFKKLLEKVNLIKKTANKKGILYKSKCSDPARITLDTSNIGYTGDEFRKHLHKFKVEPEYCGKKYSVFIPSPLNADIDFERLQNAVLNLTPKEKVLEDKEYHFKIPTTASHTVRNAVLSEFVTVSVNNSIGKCASRAVAPCPPGIPLLIPGEIIQEEERSLLINYGISEVDVLK
ncbi:MAG: PLP-dependent transferase [Oscillospiraceae bacterium]|nr:PLP-dependent transferase [Oscillospiraceae bacterium]